MISASPPPPSGIVWGKRVDKFHAWEDRQGSFADKCPELMSDCVSMNDWNDCTVQAVFQTTLAKRADEISAYDRGKQLDWLRWSRIVQ